jgi:hypothetical protein
MDYLIECALASESTEDRGSLWIRLPWPRRLADAERPVLFAHSFSHNHVPTVDELERLVYSSIEETQESMLGTMNFYMNGVIINTGSFEVTILADMVGIIPFEFSRSALSGTEIVISSAALWATDKIAGGPLSRFGQVVSERIYKGITALAPGNTANPTSSEDQEAEPDYIRNIERIAFSCAIAKRMQARCQKSWNKIPTNIPIHI